VRVQHAAVIEIDELVLAASPHRDDTRANNRSPLGGLDAAPQRGVMYLEIRDVAADDVSPELDHGALDFGKLRNGGDR
jgi:hypothetical protein